MQAITTKILPATQHRPTRCKAMAKCGSVVLSTDQFESTDEAHKEAALALCRKFAWEGSLVTGTTHQGDNVWVFVEDRDVIYAHAQSGKKEAQSL